MITRFKTPDTKAWFEKSNLLKKQIEAKLVSLGVSPEERSKIQEHDLVYFFRGRIRYALYSDKVVDAVLKIILEGFLPVLKSENVRISKEKLNLLTVIELFLEETKSRKRNNIYFEVIFNTNKDYLVFAIIQTMSFLFFNKNADGMVNLTKFCSQLGEKIGTKFFNEYKDSELCNKSKKLKDYIISLNKLNSTFDPSMLKSKLKFELRIGSLIVDYLAENNVLRIQTIIKDAKKHINIVLTDFIRQAVAVSYFGNIPLFTPTLDHLTSLKEYNLYFPDTKNSDNTNIQLTALGQSVINTNVRYRCVNFDLLLSELDTLFTDNYINFDKATEFIYKFYEVDLRSCIQDSAVVISLINFSLDLKTFGDKALADKVKNSALELLLKKIISKKYFLLTFLNQANLYREFSFFYLPVFSTSTGRMFTYSSFLTLQGAPISRAFLAFKDSQETSSDNYDKGLFLNQINSYLKPENKIKENETVINPKIVLKSIKNIKYYFNVLTLIQAYNRNKPEDTLYSLDATNSGLQIIGMLLRNETLGISTNLLGNEPHDIYTSYANYLRRILVLRKYIVKDILEKLKYYNIDLSTFINQLKVKKGKLENFAPLQDILLVFPYINDVLNVNLNLLFPKNLSNKNIGIKLEFLIKFVDRFHNIKTTGKDSLLDFITTRTFNKSPIMTSGYNIKYLGISQYYNEQLKLKIPSRQDRKFIIKFLYSGYSDFKRDHLDSLNVFTKSCNSFCEQHDMEKPIILMNKFMVVKFKQNIIDTVRVTLPNRKVAIYFKTNKTDLVKTKRSLNSLLIQHLDALIAFTFKHICHDLPCGSCHDNFYISQTLNKKLRTFVFASYLLSSQEFDYYREYFKLPTYAEKDLDLTNINNFIKH